MINQSIRAAFTDAGVATILEPQGLLSTDARRPDGVTVLPFESEKPIAWDATCVHPTADSYTAIAKREPRPSQMPRNRRSRANIPTLMSAPLFFLWSSRRTAASVQLFAFCYNDSPRNAKAKEPILASRGLLRGFLAHFTWETLSAFSRPTVALPMRNITHSPLALS